QIELTKDGKSISGGTGIIDAPDTFVYTKDIRSVEDVPIIAIYVDSVFAGTETSMLVINGIFQISESYTSVKSGTRYGEMEITRASGDTITMKNNDDEISLEEGETVDLMGDIKFLVADNSTLRFALYEEMTEPGTYDIRGTVYSTTEKPTWDHMNFEGFYYNIDDNLGTEKLEVKDDDTSIGAGKLVYTTTVQSVAFDYSDWGKYDVIGFMAEQYFAGYDKDRTEEITDETISLVSNKMLSKVLIDEDDKHMVSTGASLKLEEDYELKIIQLDVSGDKAQIELLRGGKSVDTGVIGKTPANYVYTRDIGKVDDVPLVAINVDSVFAGTESDMLVIKGIFQISEDYKSVKSGDDYGEMEVSTTSSDKITMDNPDDIDLDEGGTTMIMGDVGFTTSEDGDRYYLFVRRTIGALAALNIELPDSPVVNEELVITVTSDGSPVEGADVSFGGENLGLSDSSGEVRFTPDVAGTFTVTASKEDYDSASEDVQILTKDEAEKEKLDITMPDVAGPDEEVVIRVTSDGDAIEGATIKWDGEEIGATDDTGSLTYAHEETGTYTVTASKSGYLDGTGKITISVPAAKFELDGISLPAEVVAGKSFTITTNVTNVGDIEGTYRAELVIDDGNGTVTTAGLQNVTLAAGETETVEFTHKITRAGTYTVQIGGESGKIVVTASKSKTALVAAIIIILALLGGIGYLLISSAPEGGWTAEKLIEAIKEKMPGKKGL
ncbi:MAG TPA: S-layer protein, partial [Methanosarcinales archaeon]|nr:S-layer protein [Methanosarcinales archaeon]